MAAAAMLNLCAFVRAYGAFTYTHIHCAEMGWAALVTQSIDTFTHKLRCAALHGAGKNGSRVTSALVL